MNVVADLSREDSQREYRRSQDWLDAHDALAFVIAGNFVNPPDGVATTIACTVLDAILRGDIPGVRIDPRGSA